MPCLRVLEIVALFRKFYVRPSMTCSTDALGGLDEPRHQAQCGRAARAALWSSDGGRREARSRPPGIGDRACVDLRSTSCVAVCSCVRVCLESTSVSRARSRRMRRPVERLGASTRKERGQALHRPAPVIRKSLVRAQPGEPTIPAACPPLIGSREIRADVLLAVSLVDL